MHEGADELCGPRFSVLLPRLCKPRVRCVLMADTPTSADPWVKEISLGQLNKVILKDRYYGTPLPPLGLTRPPVLVPAGSRE